MFRRQKTVKAAKLFPGATSQNMTPAVNGLWGALVHLATVDQLCFLLGGSCKSRKAIARITWRQKSAFHKSATNRVRSVGLLYSGGVIKTKYRRMYRSITQRYCQQRKKKIPIEVSPGQQVDEPLSYDRLQAFLKRVNMPEVHPLPVLPNGEPSSVKGGRRSLEGLLLMMAERALSVPHLGEELTWLNSTRSAETVPPWTRRKTSRWSW